MTDLIIDDAKVQAAIQKKRDLMLSILPKMVEVAATEIENRANDFSPSGGIAKEVDDAGAFELTYRVGVTPDKWYLTFFETGVGAHTVTPVVANALKLATGDFAMRATPGGFAAAPFLRPAIDTGKGAATDAAAKVAKGVL